MYCGSLGPAAHGCGGARHARPLAAPHQRMVGWWWCGDGGDGGGVGMVVMVVVWGRWGWWWCGDGGGGGGVGMVAHHPHHQPNNRKLLWNHSRSGDAL
eukprot:352209-Chlamydomonas_euryale.AAC.6